MNITLSQIKAFINQITLAKKVALIVLICASTASFYYLIRWSSQPDFKMLYSELNTNDAGNVIEKLKKEKIQYKLSSDGTSILIPAENIYETRMLLASSGLPQGGGVGFEIFDNTKIGMTEFVQNVNYQRALQGELTRTINKFNEVESSRVHIVMSKKSLFLEDEDPATASVVLKLRPGASLKSRKIQGITHLVSSSISGLDPENVTIVDSYGNMLAGFETENGFGRLGTDQLAYQENIERKLENSIKTMLNSALGPDKSIVRVSCLINFKRSERTEEKYLPENKVIRSEQNLKQVSNKPSKIPMGTPGQRSYTPGDKNITNPEKDEVLFERQDQSANYEIGKVTNRIIEPIGEIKKVSVAVLVDGSYNIVKNKKGKEEKQYIPRTNEEMAKIDALVKRSVNYDPSRNDLVEVVNFPFNNSDSVEMKNVQTEEGIKSVLDRYKEFIKLGMAIIALAFVYFVILRPIIKWMTSFNASESEMIQKLPLTVNEIENQYNGKLKTLSYKDKAENMMRSENQTSASVLKDWLQQT